MSYTDMAGCRTCTIAYDAQSTCEAVNSNSVCSQQSDGSFMPTACKDGFSNSCQTRVNADKFGCGVCCDFGSQASCQNSIPNSVCSQNNDACWAVSACADKYKLVDNACIPSETCEDFGKISVANQSICSTTAQPENVTLLDGSTITCVTCGVGCDYVSIFDCLSNNPNAVCDTNDKLCPVVSGCNNGFSLVNGTCKKEYSSLISCETQNPGFVCEYISDGTGYGEGIYVTTASCKEGYTLTDGACVANCQYADESACETENFNSECTQVDGCWLPTACIANTFTTFPADLSNCMMGGRYHATKLVNPDPNGCARCGTDFNSCDQLGYLVADHASGSEHLGAGREFLFLNDQGHPRDCWILDNTCPYDTLENCQADASECQFIMGCYLATSCKSGFTLSDDTCVKDVITYGSITECEAANPGFVCEYYGGAYGDDSKYVSTGTCKSGYTLTNDTCVKDVVTYATLAECELANIMNKCISDGNGKYIAGDCLDGAYDDGTCKGVDDESGDCEYDFASYPCVSDGKGYYIPVNCPRTQAECEAEYPYDICEKATEANCWIPFGGAKYPAAEKSGECDGLWTGSYSMAYNVCGATTVENCQAVYPGFNCQQVEDPTIGTVYVPAGCMSGYTYDNGYCVADVVTYGSITECEAANPGFECDYYGGAYGDASKWVSTGECKANYKLENGACIPQTCEEGTYSSKEECEEKYPGFECGEVDDDSSLGSGAQGHSAG